MNRRNFFKILSVAAPTIFVPKLIVPVWKPLSNKWIPNPDWVNARYEMFQFEFVPAFTVFYKQYLTIADSDICLQQPIQTQLTTSTV